MHCSPLEAVKIWLINIAFQEQRLLIRGGNCSEMARSNQLWVNELMTEWGVGGPSGRVTLMWPEGQERGGTTSIYSDHHKNRSCIPFVFSFQIKNAEDTMDPLVHLSPLRVRICSPAPNVPTRPGVFRLLLEDWVEFSQPTHRRKVNPSCVNMTRWKSQWHLVLLNSLTCGLEICVAAGITYVPPLLLEAGVEEQYMTMVLGKVSA